MKFDDYEKYVNRFVEENKISGITCAVYQDNKKVYNYDSGFSDIESNISISENTVFPMLSMSKPITSFGVLVMLEEYNIDLKEKMSNYIPEFSELMVLEGNKRVPLNRPITIQDLLTHTAGFRADVFVDSEVDNMYINLYKQIDFEKTTTKEFVNKILDLPLASQPGEKWRYSVSVDILGFLIEKITGKSLEVYLNEKIFKPLNMDQTGYYFDSSKIKNQSKLYYIDQESDEIKLYNKNFNINTSKYISGGSGLFSSLNDYLSFLKMTLKMGYINGKSIFSENIIKMFVENRLNNSHLPFRIYNYNPIVDHGFGLGVRVRLKESEDYGESVGEYAWNNALNSIFWVDPMKNQIGILLGNYYPPAYYPIEKMFKLCAARSL